MGNRTPAVSEILHGRYIADFTEGGRILSANRGFYEITGYTADDIAGGGVSFYDFIPAEDYDEFVAVVEKLQSDMKGGFLEHSFRKKNGELIHVMCLAEDFTDENGHFCSKLTICDLSENDDLKEQYSRSQRELDALMENVPGGVVLYEVDGDDLRIVEANDDYYHLLGYKDRSLHPGTVGHLLPQGDMPRLMVSLYDCVENRSACSFEVRITRYDGKLCWLRLNGKYFGEAENGDPLIYAVIMDVSATKKTERDLINQTERFRMIAENTEEVYWEYNVIEDTLILANCINRYGEEDNVIRKFWGKRRCERFVHPDDLEGYRNKWTEICRQPQRGSIEFRTMAYDDDYTWYKLPYVSVANEQGEVTNVYGRLFSIETVKSLKKTIASDKAEIERLSTTDSVTDLLNRSAFKERVTKEIRENFDESCCYGILYSDINDFSYVNDNFGFDAGNQMLYDFAETIRDTQASLYACRIYSDYYSSLYKAKNREALIEAIRERNERFTSMQREKYPASDVHISCGLCFITDKKDFDVTIAMDNANLARRSVKGSKDVPCGIYTERMRKQRSHDQAIASELQSALESGQIELFLQPKFDLETREIIGAEALTRWRNPDGSYKLPYEFISVLENVGYIVELDLYIYEQTLKTMARWKSEGKALLPMSVNFSRLHNNYKSFVDNITAVADKYQIDKTLIEIEITESCFTHDVNILFSNMRKLRERGFKIDIDDFGMGYSSLSLLLNAPADIVKVDKVFIDNIASSNQARDYISHICSLINSTKKEIIFEGVETEKQAEILAGYGHKMAQGWLFGKAMPVSEFEERYLS